MSAYAFRPIDEFDEAVRRDPAATALAWSARESVAYGELAQQANRVARFLRERGVSRGTPVGLILDKTTTAFAIILACHRLGAPYFAVDPANPRERTEFILGRCQPRIVFGTAASEWLASQWPHVALNGDGAGEFDRFDASPVSDDTDVTGADPAYIMFTSGSTGFPKGVAISYQSLALFIRWARWQFEIRGSDVFSNVNPLYFDNSVFDIYASLFSGATLIPITAAELKEPAAMLAKLDALGCTSFFSVPSLLVYLQTLKLIDRRSFGSLKTMMFGGEGYPKARLHELFESIGDRVALFNVYGPTECTCICSVYRVTREDFDDMSALAPLGRLIPNFTFRIVDSGGNPAADGDIGELYLGGPCVGIGYYGDRDLTEKAFVSNPANTRWPERMYRTGDLVSCNADDGKLHFAGRADTQIKHMGYRIELGEIESALARVAGVDEAVALHTTQRGLSTIVAVVASRDALGAQHLRTSLERILPRYMVPSHFEFLDALPKNANGKIDRRELKRRYGV